MGCYQESSSFWLAEMIPNSDNLRKEPDPDNAGVGNLLLSFALP